MKTLVFISCHGFNLNKAPLGGIASIADSLAEALQRRPEFTFRLLSTDVLGSNAPRNSDFLRYNTGDWIRFYREFERAILERILETNPAETIVLSNDTLRLRSIAEKGYPVYYIGHIDIVENITVALFRTLVRPETLASIYRALNNSPFRVLVPEVLKLAFGNQEESVMHTRGTIVPSEGLKRRLLLTYPAMPADKIHVLPWGSPPEKFDEGLVTARTNQLRAQYGIADDASVLITLGRIAPEKGLQHLVKALEIWERSDSYPPGGITVLICGVGASAREKPFENAFKKSVQNLKRSRVLFPGYVTGVEKQAYLRLARLYVFPSRFESYGLTLMEAFGAGLPAVATLTGGTELLLNSDRGELLPSAEEAEIPHLLQEAMQRLLADPDKLRAMGVRAKEFADGHPFSDMVDRLVRLLIGP